MRVELAEHGFRFCTESLEAKLEKYQELQEDEKTGETEVRQEVAVREQFCDVFLGFCCQRNRKF